MHREPEQQVGGDRVEIAGNKEYFYTRSEKCKLSEARNTDRETNGKTEND